MIIWLASYPRSGSHLLRMTLQRCFNLGSFEVYQGEAPHVEPEEAAILGVRQFPDENATRFVERARSSPDLFLVKTHDIVPCSDKCIYVVRDGRAVAASSEDILRRSLTAGFPCPTSSPATFRSGAWHQHVEAFAARDPRNTLIVRYEELASDFPPLERLSKFLDRPVLRRFDIPFPRLHQLDARKYRTGRNREGIELVEGGYRDLFWTTSGQAMRTLGYDREPAEVTDAKTKIFFFHLPKSAGTSVWKVLRGLVGSDEVFQVSARNGRGRLKRFRR